MTFRAANVVLGIWLVLSAFLWAHTPAQATNACIVGILCVAVALIATRVPPARYLNSALAIWLFISAFVLPTTGLPNVGVMTTSNSIIMALAILLFSLVGRDDGEDSPPRRAPLQP